MKKRNLLAIFATLAISAGAMAAFTACEQPSSGTSSRDELQSLTIATAPTKTTYVAGESFDPTGMVVKAVYQSGEEVAVTDYTYSPQGALTVGTTRITIAWGDKTVTQRITVKNDVTSLTIKTAPTKTEYYVGETFDATGMVLHVTYENGDEKDVTVSGSAATYKTDALTKEDSQITVTFGGKTVTQAITFAEGVFIEAENGLINGKEATSDNIFTDAVGKEEQYNASNGQYVGDMKAGDSITFVFNSDKAGTGSIAFRMASQYLKKDDNWTPIWMGDCQFNKIVEFYVNGEKYNIPDTAVLPGGGSEDGEPNSDLWFNWQKVVFDNINFVAGKNTVELKFIAHDYTDTSEASFSGKFTANIDSLIVTSEECEISEYQMTVDSLAVTGVTLQNIDGVAYYVLTGKIEYTGYTVSEVEEKISFDLQRNGGAWGYYLTDSDMYDITWGENGAFTFKVALDTLADGGYISHFSTLTDGKVEKGDLKLTEGVQDGATLTIGTITYTLISKTDGTSSEDYFGCVGVYIENTKKVTLTSLTIGTDANLEVRGEDEAQKVYFVISGNTVDHTAEGFDNDAEGEKAAFIKAIQTAVYFDLQENPIAQSNGNGTWNTYCNKSSDLIITLSADGKSFEIAVDITDLPVNCYTTHCDAEESGNHDYKPNVASFTKEQTLNGKKYEMILVSGSSNGAEYWGCVGIRVSTVTVEEPGNGENGEGGDSETETTGKVTLSSVAVGSAVKLEERDGKAYYVIGGGTVEYTAEGFGEDAAAEKAAVEKAIQSAVFFELQKNTYALTNSYDGADWSTYCTDAASHIITLSADSKQFEVAVDISSLNPYYYTTHCDAETSGSHDLKPNTDSFTQTLAVNGLKYELIYEKGSDNPAKYWGCVGLQVTYVANITIGTNAKLEIRGEGEAQKVYYVISGNTVQYTVTLAEDAEAKKAAMKTAVLTALYFDLQKNPYVQEGTWGGDWTAYYTAAADHIVTMSEDGATFELAVDITGLDVYSYTTHCDGQPLGTHDYKPDTDNFTQKVTLGNKTYEITFTKDGGNENFFGCVGIRVTETAKEEVKGETETETETSGTENS
jgi:hypothetical protein